MSVVRASVVRAGSRSNESVRTSRFERVPSDPPCQADTHTYYRTMASLPGSYRNFSHCPGHDYVGGLDEAAKIWDGQ